MKLIPILLVVVAVAFAAEEKEKERPKTYRRLIPADVLRGESLSLPRSILKCSNHRNLSGSDSGTVRVTFFYWELK